MFRELVGVFVGAGVGVVAAGVLNVNPKPKLAVVEVVIGVEVATGLGGRVAEDDVRELGVEVGAESEVDAESEVGVKGEPVGVSKVNAVPKEGTRVLAASVEAPAAAQSVADTVTVDTTVTVTMPFVPITTVGDTMPLVEEEDEVAVVGALDVIIGRELEILDDGVGVASGDVVGAEADKDDGVKI